VSIGAKNGVCFSILPGREYEMGDFIGQKAFMQYNAFQMSRLN